MRKLIFILALPLILFACNSSKQIVVETPEVIEEKPDYSKGVYFVKAESYFDVLDKAEEEGKLIFLDFYTERCLPCKLMDEEVFTDKATADFFNKNFINYKVNASKQRGANLAGHYQIYMYPTLLFVDAKGNILEKKEGAAYPTKLNELAKSAIVKGGVVAEM